MQNDAAWNSKATKRNENEAPWSLIAAPHINSFP